MQIVDKFIGDARLKLLECLDINRQITGDIGEVWGVCMVVRIFAKKDTVLRAELSQCQVIIDRFADSIKKSTKQIRHQIPAGSHISTEAVFGENARTSTKLVVFFVEIDLIASLTEEDSACKSAYASSDDSCVIVRHEIYKKIKHT